MRNGLETNRLGISVKKTVGKSVERNRLRRLIKENYRYLGPDLKKGYDFVFVVRKSEGKVSFRDIKSSMEYMLRKLNILRREV
jgi:ribonuclease P protein component